MAILGDFQIAVPLHNSRFNVCNKLPTTISSISGTAITINIATTGPFNEEYQRFFAKAQFWDGATDPLHDVGKVNKVILGPSTNAGNVGAVETLIVQSASGLVITVEVAPTYLYDATDPITLIGTGLPDGWIGTFFGGGTEEFSHGCILTPQGYADQYVWEIRDIVGALNNYSSFVLPELLLNHTYKLSWKYRLRNYVKTNGLGFRIRVYKQSTGLPVADANALIEVVAGDDVWKEDSTTFKLIADESKCYFLLWHDDIATADKFEIAGIALGSAVSDVISPFTSYITDGDISISEFPMLGSIQVKRTIAGGRLVRNIDGKVYNTRSMDEQVLPVARYKITYSLSHVSKENRDQIKALLDIQNRGYFLNHFPGIEGLPYVLTGKLSANIQDRRQLTDTTISNFRLVFEEVAI